MKTPSLHAVRVVVRDVVIPLGGMALVFVQLFLPGERLGLIAAGVAMMGLSGVMYGGRKIDAARAEQAGEEEA